MVEMRRNWMERGLQLERRLNGLRGRERLRFFLIFLVVVLSLHLYGAYHNLHKTNTHITRNDQHHYMTYARKMVESDYTYVGDGNRMPLYPFIQSLHYDAAATDLEFFMRGAHVNMALSVLLLIGLFFIFQNYFSNLVTVNLMLFAVFQFYMFRAGYFQAELLYYTLAFGTYVLMLRMFIQPNWKLGILIGLMATISHMTKASMLPALAVFSACYGLQTLWESRNLTRRQIGYYVGSGALVVAVFLATFFPYALQLKRVFGQYFYNVNTTFYIWYDTAEEMETGTKLHGDRVGWPDMPAEEIPSWRKYLREKSLGDILERFEYGFGRMIERHLIPGSYGYTPYYVGSFLMVVGLALVSLRNQWDGFWRQVGQHRFVILFSLAYLTGYILLYTFYMPISSGQRFALSMLLPLVFTLTMAMHVPIFNRHWVSWFNLVMLGLLVVHGFYNVFYFVHVFYAGN